MGRDEYLGEKCSSMMGLNVCDSVERYFGVFLQHKTLLSSVKSAFQRYCFQGILAIVVYTPCLYACHCHCTDRLSICWARRFSFFFILSDKKRKGYCAQPERDAIFILWDLFLSSQTHNYPPPLQPQATTLKDSLMLLLDFTKHHSNQFLQLIFFLSLMPSTWAS